MNDIEIMKALFKAFSGGEKAIEEYCGQKRWARRTQNTVLLEI